jgi:hypothetical protein
VKTPVRGDLHLCVASANQKNAGFDHRPFPVRVVLVAGLNPIGLERFFDAVVPADCLSRKVLGGDRPASAEVGGRQRLCPDSVVQGSAR